ncbi:MAG: recombinase family protein [Bacteroidales bacterium]|nr:recombinase family protein [Bacteroidales bacterium]
MEQVAILARVSTQGQDYKRQVVELTDYYQRMNWEVVKVFANKVSGVTRNADREEISGLVEYVKQHRLNRVVCLEISRLGRNTLEALKVINYLN